MISVYVAAWLASIMYGVEAILGKITSKHSVKNPWLFNFIWTLFIAIGTVIVSLYFGAGIPVHWKYIFLTSVVWALTNVFYALSIYNLDASVLAPLYTLRTIMAVIAGSLFFGEVLSLKQYALTGIIFIFGIFVSMDERFSFRSFFNRKVAIALIGMLCLLIASLLTKKAVAVEGLWNTTLWVALLGQVWLLATIPLFKKDVPFVSIKQVGVIAIVSVAGVSGTIAAMAAYAKNVSIATSIISLPLSMVAAFILSFFLPNLLEKHTLKVYAVRFVSASIMILAALNL